MYDFKYQLHHNYRYNTYSGYSNDPTPTQKYPYKSIRNVLLLIILIFIIFFTGVFSLKFYQNRHIQDRTCKQNVEIDQTQLTQASSKTKLTQVITNSIAKNLKQKQLNKHFNREELKLLIRQVIYKIEKEPNSIKYSQK